LNKKEIFKFLDEMKAGSKINIFSAGPHLQDEFGISKTQQREIILEWVKKGETT